MNTNKPIAYIFFDKNRDWECTITTNPKDYEGDECWYLGGEVNSLRDIFQLLEAHDFDYEYYYYFVERSIPHWLYNLLNKE